MANEKPPEWMLKRQDELADEMAMILALAERGLLDQEAFTEHTVHLIGVALDDMGLDLISKILLAMIEEDDIMEDRLQYLTPDAANSNVSHGLPPQPEGHDAENVVEGPWGEDD